MPCGRDWHEPEPPIARLGYHHLTQTGWVGGAHAPVLLYPSGCHASLRAIAAAVPHSIGVAMTSYSRLPTRNVPAPEVQSLTEPESKDVRPEAQSGRGSTIADRPSPALDRLPVRVEGEIRLVPIGEVLYCYADGDRTIVVTPHGELKSHLCLARLTERLEPWRFFRCHRAYLVNLDHVRSVIPWTRNAYSLTLDGNREVPLSKHRVGALRELLNW